MSTPEPSHPAGGGHRGGTGETAPDESQVVADTRLWLERAVIGLNLCPFARAEYVRHRIAFRVSGAETPHALLADLESALRELVQVEPSKIETTLLIHPRVLQGFDDYNQFLTDAEGLLVTMGLEGVIQIASFHPDYLFAGEDPGDMSHCTNRSPHPMLHLLREASVERAVRSGEDAETIVARNLKTVRSLGPEGWKRLGLRTSSDPSGPTGS
jgi:hypothetical protein